MAFTLDPQFAAVLAPMMAAAASMPKIPPGDPIARREGMTPMLEHMVSQGGIAADVEVHDYHTKSSDGHEILLKWFKKKESESTPGPAICYFHGGGMILGTANLFAEPTAAEVSATGVPVLSVDYRLAPENPDPTPTEDCYAGLVWLSEHAAELNVDPKRIAVKGESAGGGLAAAVALMARDRKLSPPLAKQILIYPMLNDRNLEPDPNIAPFAFWDYEMNATAWKAYLGKDFGGEKVSKYAAPARETDLAGLPSAYIELGQLDIFVEEDLEYARKLTKAGVTCELHLHPGVIHAFEAIAPNIDVTKRSAQDRLRVIRSF